MSISSPFAPTPPRTAFIGLTYHLSVTFAGVERLLRRHADRVGATLRLGSAESPE